MDPLTVWHKYSEWIAVLLCWSVALCCSVAVLLCCCVGEQRAPLSRRAYSAPTQPLTVLPTQRLTVFLCLCFAAVCFVLVGVSRVAALRGLLVGFVLSVVGFVSACSAGCFCFRFWRRFRWLASPAFLSARSFVVQAPATPQASRAP